MEATTQFKVWFTDDGKDTAETVTGYDAKSEAEWFFGRRLGKDPASYQPEEDYGVSVEHSDGTVSEYDCSFEVAISARRPWRPRPQVAPGRAVTPTPSEVRGVHRMLYVFTWLFGLDAQ